MLAILGGLGAALAWTATTLTAARGSKLIGPYSFLACIMSVGMLIAGPAVLVSGIPSGLDSHMIGWLVVAGSGNVVGLISQYHGLRIGKVGLVASLASTEGAVAAVIAVVAGERLAPGVGVTLGVVALGVALAAAAPAEREVARRSDLRAALFGAGAAISFGFSIYATGRIGSSIGIAWAVIPSRAVGVLAVAIPLAISSRLRLTRAALPYVLVGGVCEVAGFASYAVGARHSLPIAAVLGSQFAALSTLAAFFLFHERLARIQLIGVSVIVCGVSALSALHG
jgi:drug/metabolite transporter (DMT)-like permease